MPPVRGQVPQKLASKLVSTNVVTSSCLAPKLTLSEEFIATHTRHDHRLVSPDSPDAKFVAVTKDGKPIAGWSGIRKTLDQLPLCLRDMARCTDEIGREEIVGVEEVDVDDD